MKQTMLIIGLVAGVLVACEQQAEKVTEPVAENPVKELHELNGYPTKEAWGEHLVAIGGCDDCHSPKMMTERGPVPDPALRLSGHPANDPGIKLDRKMIEENGYGACSPNMTAWAGPWGISYSGNLTSDPSGIGSWSEENFKKALREGKFKGMDGGRMILPPMPIAVTSQYTDAELSAIFAFLKTVPAVNNVVPAPVPPVSAPRTAA